MTGIRSHDHTGCEACLDELIDLEERVSRVERFPAPYDPEQHRARLRRSLGALSRQQGRPGLVSVEDMVEAVALRDDELHRLRREREQEALERRALCLVAYAQDDRCNGPKGHPGAHDHVARQEWHRRAGTPRRPAECERGHGRTVVDGWCCDCVY